MSQFSPPPPFGQPVSSLSAEAQPYTQPPMSTAAMVGFISSLVFCIPGVTQLVGLICGIVGIAATSGGQRRGRGLAIAAIPISLLVAVAWGGIGYAGWRAFDESMRMANHVKPLLSASGDAIAANAPEFYKRTSKRFQQQISQDEFVAWIQTVIAEHGTLQGVGRPQQVMRSDGEGRTVIPMIGQFTNGNANIELILLFEASFTPEIDDITIGGESPLPNP